MNKLIAKIYEAFSSVPYPGDDQLIEHLCDECFRLRDDFKGKKPIDIDTDTISYHFDSLPLFSAEAKRYYLPAYLRESILNPGDSVTDFLILTFDSDHRWNPKGGFTKEQIDVVNQYFSFIETHLDEFDKPGLESAKVRWLVNTEPGA